MFESIVKELIKKVKEGVEVRILFDAMGCRTIPQSYWRELRQAGIETVTFFPAVMRRLHLRINYRNHRKIVVIDNEIAYAQQMATEYSNLIVQQQAEIEQLEAERIAAEEEARRQAEAEAAAAAEEAARQEAEEEAAENKGFAGTEAINNASRDNASKHQRYCSQTVGL